jgi:hypothetical protein
VSARWARKRALRTARDRLEPPSRTSLLALCFHNSSSSSHHHLPLITIAQIVHPESIKPVDAEHIWPSAPSHIPLSVLNDTPTLLAGIDIAVRRRPKHIHFSDIRRSGPSLFFQIEYFLFYLLTSLRFALQAASLDAPRWHHRHRPRCHVGDVFDTSYTFLLLLHHFQLARPPRRTPAT